VAKKWWQHPAENGGAQFDSVLEPNANTHVNLQDTFSSQVFE
jgi:hypothetical protein